MAANGEGKSTGGREEATLGDVMRAPSSAPDVVVLDRIPSDLEPREPVLDPKEDLWLTTSDGRYNSPIVPIRVGTVPHQDIFHVHRSVLLKSDWFRKALCGGFVESSTQSLDLPAEDPAIFHFVIAYLYEDRYVPTKALATALIPDEDKGKGREGEPSGNSHDSDSDSSTASFLSNSTARSRQRRDRHRRRADREAERLRQKHPGMHRPNCSCPQCIVSLAPCFGCGFTSRVAHPNTIPPPPLPAPMPRSHRHRRRGPDGRPLPRAQSPPLLTPPPYEQVRIKGEDMRTWLMALELNIEVYICANKYLLDEFKPKIARVIIDQLETAGSDAAEIEVLHLCTRLYDGVGEHDSLLKMMFARAGFLQSTLWRKAPMATNEFLLENPEIGALILKEMAMRGETDLRSGIPSMEKSSLQSPAFVSTMQQYRPHPHRHRVLY